MQMLSLFGKDLKQVLRSRSSAIFLIIMPLFFMGLFGLTGSGSSDSRIKMGILNMSPDSAYAKALTKLLDSSEALNPVGLTTSDVSDMVREGRYAAVLIIPAEFEEQARIGKASLTLVFEQATATGQAVSNSVRAASNRLSSALLIGQISATTLGDAQSEELKNEAALSAADAWRNPPLRVISKNEEKFQPKGSAILLQMAPGILVQFAVFGLITTASLLVTERKDRTLQRLLTTPVRRSHILGGHILAMFTIVMVQEILLALVGQLFFGVDYLREPLALLLIMVTLALWSASLGLLIGALAKALEQVIILSMAGMFIFCIMGGVWFSLELTGDVFATVGHMLPTAWAMDGFQNLLVRGLDLGSVLLPSGMLVLYSFLFFGLALWRFRFE